jgi:hypothetical protein
MMFSINDITNPMNQIEDFYQVMEFAWETLSTQYDIDTPLPDVKYLLMGTDLEDSVLAAETIVANMLTEITEHVHRFSPWYRCPARAFGLISLRDPKTHKLRWRLAPEAAQQWQKVIEPLECEIAYKASLIAMIDTIDHLEFDPQAESVLAVCSCKPPKELLVSRAFLLNEGIICNCCHDNFVVLPSC